ncbi:hypothetical protein A2U01_0060012, partial [Trifolium medium]|nr:hypothetical protein [Trifolium medium]
RTSHLTYSRQPGTVHHDLLHPLSSGVLAFRGNRTMYPGDKVHVQSIPTTNWAVTFNAMNVKAMATS